MSVVSTIATQIKAVLDTVPNVGVTYAYAKMPTADWSAFVASFSTDLSGTVARHVRAWTVQYVGEQRHERTIALGATKQTRDMRWLIRGYLSWADGGPSEVTFRGLIEAIATKLDAARSLNGTVYDHDPVDVDLPNNGAGIVLGDVLCHYAEITFTAQVEETLTTA